VSGKTKQEPSKEAIDAPLPITATTPTTPVNLYLHPNHPPTVTPESGITFLMHINNGTVRVTARWKPDEYKTLLDGNNEWDYAVMDAFYYMLEAISDFIIFPWVNNSETPNIPSLDLTPNTLKKYLVPKKGTPIDSIHYLFSALPMSQHWTRQMASKQHSQSPNGILKDITLNSTYPTPQAIVATTSQ
jgi:hypothetical protein